MIWLFGALGAFAILTHIFGGGYSTTTEVQVGDIDYVPAAPTMSAKVSLNKSGSLPYSTNKRP